MTPAGTPSGTTPDPGERARAERLARLRLARALHPDRGGDHDAYVAAMAALDAEQGGSPGTAPRPTPAERSARSGQPDGDIVFVVRRGWRWPRRWRRRLRDVRRRNWARL